MVAIGLALAPVLTETTVTAADPGVAEIPDVTESTGRMGSVLRWSQSDGVRPTTYSGAVPVSEIPTPLRNEAMPQVAWNVDPMTVKRPVDPAVDIAPLPSVDLPAPAAAIAPGSRATFNADDCPDAKQENPISTAILDRIPVKEQVPNLCPMMDDGFVGRCWDGTCYHWTASALCSKPIYFIDNNLERYGQTNGPLVQPLVSAGHFFLSVPMLPYAMGLYPPNECIYALGDYRPGSYAPKYLEPLPISFRAIAAEGLVAGGAVAILP
ncbi:MAG: hypothetical protein Q4C47_03660 [Planctomycetia bacterium]|nr:hypothetical protein [Planctomycetia bacterium]